MRLSWVVRVVLAVVLVGASAGCGAAATPTAAPVTESAATGEVYKIGFLASVTGAAATLGEPERNVAVMIQEQLNASGGIVGPDGTVHPVEIIIQDTQGSPDVAVTLIKKLIDDEGVLAIVGPTTSGASMAVVPIAQEARVPLVSMASSSAIVEPVAERAWVFKTAASNEHTAPLQVEYARAKGITRIANLYVNNAYGEDGAIAIREAAAAAGVEIVYEDTFEEADTDITSQITKVRASQAEAVLVTAIPPAAAVFTRQYRELGVELPLIHNHGIGMPAFVSLAGPENAEGVVFPMSKLVAYESLPDDDPQKPVIAQFVADYRASTKQEPSSFAGHAWDGLNIVIEALKRLPEGLSLAEQRARLRDEIEATKDFVGIDGVFNFTPEDHVGLSANDMVLIRIVDGEWQYFPRDQW
ncbi:MAG: ABC transporter substrate-binding protein [Anaerolineae bacterium]|nr:ABC transporter substrate-binding protein [Anaerolineae bacterium]